MIFADVAAEDRHGSDTDRQCEECLVHGRNNHIEIDLAKVRQQVEAKAFCSSAQRKASYRKHEHETQQCSHHVLRHTLQS